MSKEFKIEVTICKICNTLSVHYGPVDVGSCTRCSDIGNMEQEMMIKDMERQYLIEDQRMMDLLNGLSPDALESNNDDIDWDKEKTDIPSDLKAEIDMIALQMAGALDSATMNQLGNELVIGSMNDLGILTNAQDPASYFARVPLLKSIRRSFMDDWTAVNTILDEFNAVLTKPSSHWTYLSDIELRKDALETKVGNVNSYINELHLLGFDVVDLGDAIFCAISSKPNEPWDGMDPENRDNAICLYYGQSDDEDRLTWTHIMGSWKNSQDFLI